VERRERAVVVPAINAMDENIGEDHGIFNGLLGHPQWK
jgi:hypothetical protein